MMFKNLIKTAAVRWTKGPIENVIERATRININPVDVFENTNTLRNSVAIKANIKGVKPSAIKRFTDKYESKYLKSSKKELANTVNQRLFGRLTRDDKTSHFFDGENLLYEDAVGEKATLFSQRLKSLKDAKLPRKNILDSASTAGFDMTGIPEGMRTSLIGREKFSKDGFAAKDGYTLTKALKTINIPTRNTYKSTKEIIETHGLYPFDSKLSSFEQVRKNPMHKFLKGHNYFEGGGKELRDPLTLYKRLPGNNAQELDASLDQLQAGIGAGVDFRKLVSQTNKSKPHKIMERLTQEIDLAKNQLGRSHFMKERPEYKHLVDEKNIEHSPYITETRGANLSAMSGERGGCWGSNVCISNKGAGTHKTIDGSDYVDSVLKGKARIIEYKDPESKFNALVFADKATGEVVEIKGKSNAYISKSDPHFPIFTERMSAIGIKPNVERSRLST